MVVKLIATAERSFEGVYRWMRNMSTVVPTFVSQETLLARELSIVLRY